MSLFNFNPFTHSRSGDSWFPAGPSTSYPNITASGTTPLSAHLPWESQIQTPEAIAQGCRVFYVPSDDSTQSVEVTQATSEGAAGPADLKDQVVVFQYQGHFHAVDHSCPHSSYPLSKGTPFDIEDFGVRLSAGIRCPKHDWSFDLVRGNGDRGNYRLKIWEVQLRAGKGSEGGEQEVWVRRKQRMG